MDLKGEGLEPVKKKTSFANIKRASWDMYVGIGIQDVLCGLCGINRIQNNVNSGFEGAHIIARGWLTEDLSVYYLYPSCSVCNNQCHDMCILDFLYARNRIKQLRKMIMVIYERYVVEHEHELAQEDRMAHLILDNLYGPKRFPSGGGIQNTKQIYEIARAEQYEYLLERSRELEKQVSAIQAQRRFLMELEIKPMRLQ